jgi:hypothetical protein
MSSSSDELLSVNVRLEPNERAQLDAYRRAQEAPPSRPQAIRELLRIAFDKNGDRRQGAAA